MFKRNFWTVARGTLRGNVIASGEYGLIFKHKAILLHLSKTVDKDLSHIVASMHGANDRGEHFVGERVVVEYEQHLIGSPLKGDIFDPTYVKMITYE